MAKDFFRDVGTSIFKPVGDFISGGVTALQPGRVQQMQIERKRIQALLDSEASRTLMNKARAAAMDRGEGYYGGRGVDPYVKGAEDLGKIRQAKDKFTEEELAPETAAYFDAAEKSVLDRMKSTPKVRDNRAYFEPQDETDVFEALGKKKRYEAPTEWLKSGEVPGIKQEKEGKILADYFQAPTETVPEENIPRTYPQLGIESVDDMATLQEMQQALPDVDMRQEYEADPEIMKKLIQLWKEGKLNKQNLHKAFSTIQQSAQQALGIR